MDFVKFLCLLMLYDHISAEPNLAKAKVDQTDVSEQIHQIIITVKKQQEVIKTQNNIIKRMENDVIRHNTQEKSIKKLTESVNKMKNKLVTLGERINMLQRKSSTYQTTVYGCVFDVMALSCNVNETLFVTEASYGHYAAECNSECCIPDLERDCIVNVASEDPDTWVTVRVDCNYENSCLYQYQGAAILECGAAVADYMTLKYGCISDDDNRAVEPVAFTVYTRSGDFYNAGDVVDFGNVITNIGGHFSTINSTFICPQDGLYLFTLNLMCDDEDNFVAYIMRNSNMLVSVFADELSLSVQEVHHEASNTVLTECNAGDAVWVEAQTYGQMYPTGNHNTFSGVLLNYLNGA